MSGNPCSSPRNWRNPPQDGRSRNTCCCWQNPYELLPRLCCPPSLTFLSALGSQSEGSRPYPKHVSSRTFLTLPSTSLMSLRTPVFTNTRRAAPTSCPLRRSTYSSVPTLLAFAFRVFLTACSHVWRLAGSVDIICCGLNSTISWKPTATMSGCPFVGTVSGHNQADSSSVVPCPFPLRLKVPAQIWIDFDDEKSRLLLENKYKRKDQCPVHTVWSARLLRNH